MRKKIAVIGGGQIGQIVAMLAAQKEFGDIVVLDVDGYVNVVKGKALDLMEMAPHGYYDANITATTDYKDIAGADVVIITAGKAARGRDDPGRPAGRQSQDHLGRGRRREAACCPRPSASS